MVFEISVLYQITYEQWIMLIFILTIFIARQVSPCDKLAEKYAHSGHIYLINNPLTYTKVNDFVLLWFNLSSIYGYAGSLLNGWKWCQIGHLYLLHNKD